MSKMMSALEQMRSNYYSAKMTGLSSIEAVRALQGLGMQVDALLAQLYEVHEAMECRQGLVTRAMELAEQDESDEELLGILETLLTPELLKLSPPNSTSKCH